MTEKTYTITKPEPFILGSGENKYPGGYLCKVLRTVTQEVVYETLDVSPQISQQSCIIWCMMQQQQQPEPIVEQSPIVSTENISG